MAVTSTGGAPQQYGPLDVSISASGGRTFIFVGDLVDVSTGDLVADGFLAGGILRVQGSASNDGFYLIAAVSTVQIQIVGTFNTEGPNSSGTLSATSPFKFVFGSELQNGRFGGYLSMSLGDGFPGAISLSFDGGPGVTGRWGPGGISIAVRVRKVDGWGAQTVTLTLEVFSPLDGTTVIASGVRVVNGVDDADYAPVTVSQEDLVALREAGTLVRGDQLRLRLRVQEAGVPAGYMFPYLRFGKLLIDQA